MSSLLLEKDLRGSDKGSEVRNLARARTLTVLGRLDPSRKTALMQFLVEADLVQRVDGRDPIISLRSANLRDADLRIANLNKAYLYGANLSDANLNNAFLMDANLLYADLSKADLTGAEGVTNEELEQEAESLEGATMPNGQKYKDWVKDKKAQGKDEKNE